MCGAQGWKRSWDQKEDGQAGRLLAGRSPRPRMILSLLLFTRSGLHAPGLLSPLLSLLSLDPTAF